MSFCFWDREDAWRDDLSTLIGLRRNSKPGWWTVVIHMMNNIRNEIVARLRSEQVDIINPECRLAESTNAGPDPSENNAMSRRPSLRGLAPSAIGSNRI